MQGRLFGRVRYLRGQGNRNQCKQCRTLGPPHIAHCFKRLITKRFSAHLSRRPLQGSQLTRARTLGHHLLPLAKPFDLSSAGLPRHRKSVILLHHIFPIKRGKLQKEEVILTLKQMKQLEMQTNAASIQNRKQPLRYVPP